MTDPQNAIAVEDAILTVSDLHVTFGRGRRAVRAVDGVSFALRPGRTLAIVGESGAGKTTVARAIMRLLTDCHVTGRVTLAGRDVLAAGRGDMRDIRRSMQMVFQDPTSSLDPRMTAGQIVAEPLLAQPNCRRDERMRLTSDAIDKVGLPGDSAERYPHEFSGGQRQRIAIARAIVARPGVIVCDEPVSSLDVSIRAQLLNLLADLQDELQLSYLLIAHDLAVVDRFADDVVVMQRGKIVEAGETQVILNGGAKHAYTRSLIAAAGVQLG